jgi:hypothetical protein
MVLVNNNLHPEYNCLFDLEFQRVSFFAFPVDSTLILGKAGGLLFSIKSFPLNSKSYFLIVSWYSTSMSLSSIPKTFSDRVMISNSLLALTGVQNH